MTPDFISLFHPESPEEGADAVWLWRSEAASMVRAEGILTGEEIERVSRLVDENQRRRLTAHLCSRKQLLSLLVDAHPGDISIAYDDDGRPFLPQWPDLRISFADSNGWSALAFSRTAPIGVDVEFVRPVSWEAMLPMISGAEEAEDIRNAAGDAAAPDAFFRCWTAKEAVLKAEGRGMRGDARRVRLPAAYIRGQTNSARMEKDGATYQLDVIETAHTIVARARRL